MEKFILRVEESKINELTSVLENEVFPAVAKIAGKLTEIGVTDNQKQIITEAFGGSYASITEAYKANLEKDAKNFATPSAKESVLAQLDTVISNFKTFVADATNSNIYDLKHNSPEALEYYELNKKGEPKLTKENREAIKERFTIYVSTELGAKFKEVHDAYVKATSELYKFCKENNIGGILAMANSFYEIDTDMKGAIPRFIDYDRVLLNSLPTPEATAPRDNTVVVKPRTENTFKDISKASREGKAKRVNPDKY